MTSVASSVQRKSSEIASFEKQARAVLSRLRSTLAAVLASASEPPGRSISTATDLQRTLDLNSKLSWQLHKLATTESPLAVGAHVPKPAAMKRFIEAAARSGVPTKRLESVAAAMLDFDDLVQQHAGDRASFDSMISHAAGGEAANQTDLQHRRQAFRAQSHIFGVQAQTRLACYIAQPSADTDWIDMASIRGMVGLRRFRRDVTYVLAKTKVQNCDGSNRTDIGFEPLDPRGQELHGVNLLRDFCTHPLPEIRNVVDADGWVVTELVSEDVGNAGTVTGIVGEVLRRGDTRYRDPKNERLELSTSILKPFELLIADFLVREGTYGDPTPPLQALIFNDLDERPARPFDNRTSCLPCNESVIFLGKGPEVLHTPEVPRYPEMVQYAFDRLGWDAEEFEVYRCRIEYPVLPSTVVMQLNLPEKPEARHRDGRRSEHPRSAGVDPPMPSQQGTKK